EAVTNEGSRTAISDANGRFVLDDLPHGPVHFVVTDPGNDETRPVITPTIQI
ncbi:MAG: carboxypeptidase regulatory-like domain-containing protein, partial [Dermatophilaceae bacterium]|nr:carboxypeptidase regulatory-like domain-containing protein [Dermatophilaceae bacterium]